MKEQGTYFSVNESEVSRNKRPEPTLWKGRLDTGVDALGAAGKDTEHQHWAILVTLLWVCRQDYQTTYQESDHGLIPVHICFQAQLFIACLSYSQNWHEAHNKLELSFLYKQKEYMRKIGEASNTPGAIWTREGSETNKMKQSNSLAPIKCNPRNFILSQRDTQVEIQQSFKKNQ